MLPDYPRAKEKWRQRYFDAIEKNALRAQGVFATIPVSILHEGTRVELDRRDGSMASTDMTAIEAKGLLRHEPEAADQLRIEDIKQLIQELGVALARAKSNFVMETFERTVQETGNIIDGKGSAVKTIFEFVRTQDIEFDARGLPRLDLYSFIAPPEKRALLAAAALQIERDPELSARLNQLLIQKRREWLDREATRELVD